jgi:site-specific recombinase XerD
LRSILPGPAILGDRLLASFARSLGDQDLSPVTVRDYLHDLQRFQIWMREDRRGRRREVSLRRLTTVQLVHYRQHLLDVERLQAATINRKIQALKKLFVWARQKGHVKLNVASDLQFVRVEKRLRPRGLTEAEIQALLRAAGQTGHGLAKRNYALLEVLLETGLRVGEACRRHRYQDAAAVGLMRRRTVTMPRCRTQNPELGSGGESPRCGRP